jgi:hypothetical protein
MLMTTTEPAWLLPSAPKRVWWKNPWALFAAGVFVVGFFGAYWYVAIPLVLVIGGGLVWWFRRRYREQEYARLRAAADAAYRNGEVLPPRPPWEN